MNRYALRWNYFAIIGILGLLLVAAQSAQGNDLIFLASPLTPTSLFQAPKPDKDLTVRPLQATLLPADISLEKVCTPTETAVGEEVTCTVTAQNLSSEEYNVAVLDRLSSRYELIEGSASGGEMSKGNRVITYRGPLAGGVPPTMFIGDSSSPAGYRSLAAEGIPPLTNIGDETIVNFATPAYFYNGAYHTNLAMTSNGYAIAGAGNSDDLSPFPQVFPDTAVPNNVIAPLWTDLNPAAGGFLYAALLSTAGGDSWIVLEWEDVPAFGDGGLFTFQIWLRTDIEAQEVSYIYHRMDGDGATTGTNIGAENAAGTVGVNYKPLPAADEELGIYFTPGSPGEPHVMSYSMQAVKAGEWHICAIMKAYTPRSVIRSCVDGRVHE
jgi:hypothetical protein